MSVGALTSAKGLRHALNLEVSSTNKKLLQSVSRARLTAMPDNFADLSHS
jgi:hypothetical protein